MTEPLFERESGQPVVYRSGGTKRELVPPDSLGSLDRILHALSGPEAFLETVFPVRPDRISLPALESMLDTWVERYGLLGGKDLTRLLFLLDRYPAELEWDLRQHLRVDLGDLWRARRWRQLLSFIDMLPQNTRYHQAVMSDPEHVERLVQAYMDAGEDSAGTSKPAAPPLSTWSPEVEKLTALIDAVNFVSWTVAASNSEKEIPQPKPSPRPDSEVRGRVEYLRWEKAHARHKSRARRLVPHRYTDRDEGE